MIYRPSVPAGSFVLHHNSGIFGIVASIGNTRKISTNYSLFEVSDEDAENANHYCVCREYYDGQWEDVTDRHFSAHNIKGIFNSKSEAQDVYDAVVHLEVLSRKMSKLFEKISANIVNAENPDTSMARQAMILSKIIELKMNGYDDTLQGAEADLLEKVEPHFDEFLVIGWMAAD